MTDLVKYRQTANLNHDERRPDNFDFCSTATPNSPRSLMVWPPIFGPRSCRERFASYYVLRSLIPLPVRQLLQRYRRVEISPRWYFPEGFTDCPRGQLAEAR